LEHTGRVNPTSKTQDQLSRCNVITAALNQPFHVYMDNVVQCEQKMDSVKPEKNYSNKID